jgi:hypothetical protein
MATKPETTKTPKQPVPMATKVQDQLTRAVLTKKITKEELTAISEHITKLLALV